MWKKRREGRNFRRVETEIPGRRVVFSTTDKFDGESERQLFHSEILQVRVPTGQRTHRLYLTGRVDILVEYVLVCVYGMSPRSGSGPAASGPPHKLPLPKRNAFKPQNRSRVRKGIECETG